MSHTRARARGARGRPRAGRLEAHHAACAAAERLDDKYVLLRHLLARAAGREGLDQCGQALRPQPRAPGVGFTLARRVAHPVVVLRLLPAGGLDHALGAELVGRDGLAQHRDRAVGADLPRVLRRARARACARGVCARAGRTRGRRTRTASRPLAARLRQPASPAPRQGEHAHVPLVPPAPGPARMQRSQRRTRSERPPCGAPASRAAQPASCCAGAAALSGGSCSESPKPLRGGMAGRPGAGSLEITPRAGTGPKGQEGASGCQ